VVVVHPGWQYRVGRLATDQGGNGRTACHITPSCSGPVGRRGPCHSKMRAVPARPLNVGRLGGVGVVIRLVREVGR
jgi:hypothetical protein